MIHCSALRQRLLAAVARRCSSFVSPPAFHVSRVSRGSRAVTTAQQASSAREILRSPDFEQLKNVMGDLSEDHLRALASEDKILLPLLEGEPQPIRSLAFFYQKAVKDMHLEQKRIYVEDEDGNQAPVVFSDDEGLRFFLQQSGDACGLLPVRDSTIATGFAQLESGTAYTLYGGSRRSFITLRSKRPWAGASRTRLPESEIADKTKPSPEQLQKVKEWVPGKFYPELELSGSGMLTVSRAVEELGIDALYFDEAKGAIVLCAIKSWLEVTLLSRKDLNRLTDGCLRYMRDEENYADAQLILAARTLQNNVVPEFGPEKYPTVKLLLAAEGRIPQDLEKELAVRRRQQSSYGFYVALGEWDSEDSVLFVVSMEYRPHDNE